MNYTNLSVYVTTYDGGPIPEAEVIHTDDATGVRVTVVTDKQGYAHFKVGPDAPAHLAVRAKGYGPDERPVGNGYPTGPDGIEQFILGPADWPAYYRGRVRVPFQPFHNAVGVQVDESLATEDTDTRLKSLSDETVEMIHFEDPTVMVVRVPAVQRDDDTNKVDEQLRLRSQKLGLGQVGALVELSDEGASFLTDTITVSFLPGDIDVSQVAARHGLEIVQHFSALPRTYIFRSPGGAGYDLLDHVASLAAEPGVRYAEPSLIHTVVEDAVTPDDYLFPQQWDHQLIETPGAWQVLQDLNADHTFGDPDITIAVVDNGIDAAHPAMAGNLSDNNPKVAQLFDFARLEPNNDVNAGDHGMACASAAAGNTNNAQGQAGVAGNCRVIGIRRAGRGYEPRYAEMYQWLAGFDIRGSGGLVTIRGYPEQLSKGVDVITNSFGYSVGVLISGLMQDTFDLITDEGRGGLGTLLFFSAGNEDRQLDWTKARPWGMYNRCYGISTSTLDDAGDEVKAEYSSFGSTVDFCAPSNSTWAPVIHDPPWSYGAFTATRGDAPQGHAIPGTAETTTTLSITAVTGVSRITVADVTGAVIGGAVLVGPVTDATSRGRTITDINSTTKVISLDDPTLPGNFGIGTQVTFAPRLYRSNFGGTSYATPVTAGVAALMLSANPQLSWQQVGDILGDTAIKIDADNTGGGRWSDAAGLTSNDPGYSGPVFSEWYGAGRIDAAAAVTRAAWNIELVTEAVEFTDIPEGETTYRAVHFNVHSLYESTFGTTDAPEAPFDMPLGDTATLSGSSQYSTVQEAYLWVAFTGETPGSSRSGSITVRHDQTGQQWTLPITANTVAQKTATVMLVLDRSGSMQIASGVGTDTRMEVLKYSAGILLEAVHEGDSVGIVSFDHHAQSVIDPPLGPLEAPTVIDPDRDRLRAAIEHLTPGGLTSIGSGLELGQDILEEEGFDADTIKANVVFTDGHENKEKWIADVGPSVTDRTYAVALGTVDNIKPEALTELTNGTGGYCLVTDDLNNDSRFKLAKYFLQVFAGVKNDQIVVDPPVQVRVGETIEVPFELAEADSVVDVILLTQYPHVVEMTLITPEGDILDEAFMTALGGRNYKRIAEDIVYYRLMLPAPIADGAHAGTWHARFHLSKEALDQEHKLKHSMVRERKAKYDPKTHFNRGQLTDEELKTIMRYGVTGTLLVHASSNLRMNAQLQQKSFEPEAEVLVQAKLTEYDVPVRGRAKVQALLTDPHGGTQTIPLSESRINPGVYEEPFKKDIEGIWTVLINATGRTFHGSLFTREMICTTSGRKGGDSYTPRAEKEPLPPKRSNTKDKLWKVLQHDKRLIAVLRERLAKENLRLEDLFEQPLGRRYAAQDKARKTIRSDQELVRLLNDHLKKHNLKLDDLTD